MTINVDTIVQLLTRGAYFTIVCGLVYVIYMLIAGKLVPRWVFDHVVEAKRVEKEDYRKEYDEAIRLAKRGTELAEKMVHTRLAEMRDNHDASGHLNGNDE